MTKTDGMGGTSLYCFQTDFYESIASLTMKLHQLRYLVAIADHDLNITAAALALHTVQPGVSKQIMLLEEELGFKLFLRRGKALTRITPSGNRVLARAREILREVEAIKNLAAELRKDEKGSLSIATTHLQARYVLPEVLRKFREGSPKVNVHLHQGDSEQIAAMVAQGYIDLVVATGNQHLFSDLVLLPCYRWRRVIVVTRDHPLAGIAQPTLTQLVRYPIITYSFDIMEPSSLLKLFKQKGLSPDIALSAWDTDVIKAYIRNGFGIGIASQLGIHPTEDNDLVCLDASHLLPEQKTWVGFRRGSLLRHYVYDFITLLAPHLSRRDIQAVELFSTQAEVDDALASKAIPFRTQGEPPVSAPEGRPSLHTTRPHNSR